MSRFARNLAFRISNQDQYKRGCKATEDNKKLEISHLDSSGIVLSMKRNHAALISSMVNLIADLCLCFCKYAKSRFSNEAALKVLDSLYLHTGDKMKK